MHHPKTNAKSSGSSPTCFGTSIDDWLTPKHKSAISRSDLRTSIVCELGPATNDSSTLKKMIEEGMRIAKINSMDKNEMNRDLIKKLKAATVEFNKQMGINVPIAVALETHGGLTIRTGTLQDGLEEIKLEKGASVKIVFSKNFEENCSSEVIWINYPQLGRMLKGKQCTLIFIDDVTLVATKADVDSIQCLVKQEAILRSRRPVFLPGIIINCNNVQNSVYDLQYIKDTFLKDLQVDMVFVSLNEPPEGVAFLRSFLGKHIKIVAKIGNLEDLRRLNDTLKVADGIVVLREELIKYVPTKDMHFLLKSLIHHSHKVGKPVVISGQVLATSLTEPEPSLLDAVDISTMVSDGADAIELARGWKYPIKAVSCLASLCRTAEAAASAFTIKTFLDGSVEVAEMLPASQVIAAAAVKAAMMSQAKCIICITNTGGSALSLLKYSPPCPVIVVTECPQVAKMCLLFNGLLPIIMEAKEESTSFRGHLWYAIKYGKAINILQSKDTIIILYVRIETSNKEKDVRSSNCYLEVETVDKYEVEA